MVNVSVIIVTYNREDTIGSAIESVLEQSYEDFELVIVDDGSTDSTSEIISEYQEKDNRIKYVKHNENLGQNYARNTGLQHSNGNIISYLDSDDEFTFNHLETIFNEFEQSSDDVGGILSSYYKIIDGDRESITYTSSNVSKADIADVTKETPAHFSGFSFRRDILDDIGYHDVHLVRCTDTDFFMQILDKYIIKKIPEKLFVKKYDVENRVGKDYEKIINGRKRMLRKHRSKFNDFQKANQHVKIGMAYLNQGQKQKATQCFSKVNNVELPRQLYYQIAREFAKTGNLKEARHYYKILFTKKPTDIRIILSYIFTFTSKEHFDLAVKWKRRVFS